MNFVPNQNRKVLEETLTGLNSDAMNNILRGLWNYRMMILLLQVLEKLLTPPHSSATV